MNARVSLTARRRGVLVARVSLHVLINSVGHGVRLTSRVAATSSSAPEDRGIGAVTRTTEDGVTSQLRDHARQLVKIDVIDCARGSAGPQGPALRRFANPCRDERRREGTCQIPTDCHELIRTSVRVVGHAQAQTFGEEQGTESGGCAENARTHPRRFPCWCGDDRVVDRVGEQIAGEGELMQTPRVAKFARQDLP